MSPDPQETADLVTFTEEILNGKLHFCAVLEGTDLPLFVLFIKCYFSNYNFTLLLITRMQ